MSASIDQLQIEITSHATKANDAIDRLVVKLERLSTSLQRVDGSKLTGLGNGVSRLGTAMQSMNNVRTADFTRLATNIQKLGNINVAALNSAASSMSHLTRAFNGLGTVSANAQAVGDMARNISRLGNKGVQTAIANIPQLAVALKNLMTTLSSAPHVSSNIIQMTNALANLASQGRNIGTASNVITSGLNRTSKASALARNRIWSLSSAIGKFYQTYFIVSLAVKGLKAAITSTSDYIESFNYYTVAFEKIASDWNKDWEKYGYENGEAYAKSFTERMNETLGKMSGIQVSTSEDGNTLLTSTGLKNLGLNIQGITQYASQIASVTNSVGLRGEASLAAASSLTKLAGDVSSLFNIDYSSASKNLQSGLIGQSRALYKYGIDITNATLQTYAYELGVKKAVAEMTQAEKMQLRLIAILDQSKVSWGDLANTINSPSNMMRQFSTNLSECGTLLGQLFIPILQKVLPWLNGVTIAFKNLLVNMAGFMGVKLDLSSFGQGYSDTEDELEDVTDSFEDATEAAKEYKNQILGFDEINKLKDIDDSANSSSLADTVDLTAEILAAVSEYEKVWNEAYAKMESKGQEWAKRISAAFVPLENVLRSFSIGDYFQAGQDVSALVVGINEFLTKAIDNVDWEELGNHIGEFLKGVEWTEILSSIGELIWEAITSALELWKGSFNAAPIETGIITGIALLKWTGLGAAVSSSIAQAIAAKLGVSIAANAGIGTAIKTGLVAQFSKLGTNIGFLFEGLGSGLSLNESLKYAFGLQNGITLPNILVKISSLGFALQGSPIEKFASDLVAKIDQALTKAFPESSKFFGDFLVGFVSVGVASAGNPIAAVIGGLFTSCPIKINWFDEGGVFSFEWTKDWFEEAKEAFKTAFDGNRTDLMDMGGWILEGILDGFVGAFSFIFEPIARFFDEIWQGICDIFGISSPAKEMKPLGAWILKGVLEGFVSTFTLIPTKTEKFFKVFSNGFTTEKFKGNIGSISGALSSKWSEALLYWKNKKGLSKISAPVADFLQSIKDAWNKVKSWWDNNKPNLSALTLTMKMPHISISYDTKAWNAGLFQALGLEGKPEFSVSYYAGGGMPNTGELFMARENGINEMVGRIGNRSAVANNDQIVQSIQGGVEAAMMNVMMAFSGNMNGNSDAPIVENVWKCDSETMYRMTKKGKEKHDGRYHVVTEF